MSSLTIPLGELVKEISCTLTISQTLNPKKETNTVGAFSIFGESSDEEDTGKAVINN